VATELSRQQLQHLARLGAERRLQELRDEEAAIRAAFPDLGGSSRGSVGPGGPRRRGRRAAAARTRGSAAKVTASAAKTRRGSTMTAAQRRAVSERMKKYWAARRKANE
jgi:hypothetical protein